MIANVENNIELLQHFAADDAHFLRPNASGKEADRNIGKPGTTEDKHRQDSFFHLDRVAKRILQAGFFGDFDVSVYASVRGESIVQQDSPGIAGMKEKFVGVGFPFNQATALDQKQSVLVFYFQALVLFHFAGELVVKCDAALIEIYFHDPILKEIQPKLPVRVVT